MAEAQSAPHRCVWPRAKHRETAAKLPNTGKHPRSAAKRHEALRSAAKRREVPRNDEHLALRDSTPPAPSTALAPLLRNAAAPDEAAAGGKLTEHIQLVPNETFKRLHTPPRAIPPQACSPPSAPHRKKQLLADLDAAADAPLVAASTADYSMAELQQDN